MNSILIVEDDLTYAMMLKTWLEKKGFKIFSSSSISRACKCIESETINLILSDLRLPDNDGIYLLQWMKENNKEIPLIIMTGYAEIQSAVQAIKLGACDYISKPVNPEELLKKIGEALQQKKNPATSKPIASTPIEKETTPPNYIEGESDISKQLYNYVNLVAPTNMGVLINGSSGTGKEYIAHRIHQLSKRHDKPFIAIDCGSIPKELAGSEFFGHVKGAFTGAITDKTGAFVSANGGTIFLDEIGNLSYEVQVQLLRALQERKVRPIGSDKEMQVDIRLISATNENLEKATEKGTFRQDLFHRINEFTIHMPDLKDRHEDILLFANFFLDQANRELEKKIIGFDQKATQVIRNYSWPGNLRQLKNVIKRATLLAKDDFITVVELGTEVSPQSSILSSMPLHNEEAERKRIIEALQITNNNKSKAAQLLNIDRKTLYNKLKQYNINL